jgi:hypothetical protein
LGRWGEWLELAQDRAQLWLSVFVILNLSFRYPSVQFANQRGQEGKCHATLFFYCKKIVNTKKA